MDKNDLLNDDISILEDNSLDLHQDYDVKICRIIDAKHHEEVGTDEDPTYKQSIRLLLEDIETNFLFVSPLSEDVYKELCDFDFDIHSKNMIEIAEKLRNWEGNVKVLVPKNDSKKVITKDMLLNTPNNDTIPGTSYRKAAFDRFKFNKNKIKGNQ